jgi:hypothetical protein
MIAIPAFFWIFMRCYDCAFLWREARISYFSREVRPALSGICIQCGSIDSFERGRSRPGPKDTALRGCANAPPLTNRGIAKPNRHPMRVASFKRSHPHA